MTARPRSSAEVVNTFGFNVPCRRFHFTYSVNHDRGLPVVDEFFLRLLMLSDGVPASRIGGFLGLSARELDIVLGDLQARELATVKGELVYLSRQAKEAVRLADGHAPKIVEVTSWTNAIWIELVSRGLMAPSKLRAAANFVALEAAAASRRIPDDYARSAFERNFRRIVSQIRGMRNPERFRLYSVSNVVPDRFDSVVVQADLQLSFDPSPHTTLRTVFEEAEEPERHQELIDAVHNAVRKLNFATPSAAGLQDFRRLTGDGSLFDFLLQDGSLNLLEWLTWATRNGARGRTPVYGQIYVARNIERFVQELKRTVSRLTVRQQRFVLRWLRPAGNDWGATPDLASALAAATAALKPSLVDGGTVQTIMLAPPSLKGEMKRFRRVFHTGVVSSQPALASGVEVLLIQGVAAVATVRVALASKVILPVGFILTASDDLARVEKGLRIVDATRNGEVMWRRNEDDEQDAESEVSSG